MVIVWYGLLCHHVEEKLGWNNIVTNAINDEMCMHKKQKKSILMEQLSLVQTAQWISVVHLTSDCFDSNKAVETVLSFHGDIRGRSWNYSRLCG